MYVNTHFEGGFAEMGGSTFMLVLAECRECADTGGRTPSEPAEILTLLSLFYLQSCIPLLILRMIVCA
jgi:hypothetical protein